MKINILICDTFPELLPPHLPDYQSLFIDLFASASEGRHIEYGIYMANKEELPSRLSRDEIYLIPGSMSSAYDNEQWIDTLSGFICRAFEARVPLVGVCFGHQAIAKALGGRVERAPVWGTGIRRSRIITPAAMTFFPDGHMHLHYNHNDQVVELPVGAKAFATSDFCPIEGFTIGDNVLTFQGHPEYTDAYNRFLLDVLSEDDQQEVKQRGLESIDNLRSMGQNAAQWILSLV